MRTRGGVRPVVSPSSRRSSVPAKTQMGERGTPSLWTQRVAPLYLSAAGADIAFVCRDSASGEEAGKAEGEERLYAHKLVLALVSPVFEKMFEFDAKCRMTSHRSGCRCRCHTADNTDAPVDDDASRRGEGGDAAIQVEHTRSGARRDGTDRILSVNCFR